MSKMFCAPPQLICAFRNLALIFIISLEVLVAAGCDTPQGKVLTTELAAVSPESAIMLAVNEWARENRYPYRNLKITFNSNDMVYRSAFITVEFRETSEDMWTFAWTYAEVEYIGFQWLAPTNLVFRAYYFGRPYHVEAWRVMGENPGNSSADSAVVTAFMDWASKRTIPYKNLAVEDPGSDMLHSKILVNAKDEPSFLTVRVWASFQASPKSGWEERWTDLLCSKVGSQWKVVSDFHFAEGTPPTQTPSPTPVPTTSSFQAPISTATPVS